MSLQTLLLKYIFVEIQELSVPTWTALQIIPRPINSKDIGKIVHVTSVIQL